PEWASHIPLAIEALQGAEAACRNAARARLWRVVPAALFASLRALAGRGGPASAAEREGPRSRQAVEMLQQGAGERAGAAGRGSRLARGPGGPGFRQGVRTAPARRREAVEHGGSWAPGGGGVRGARGPQRADRPGAPAWARSPAAGGCSRLGAGVRRARGGRG